MAEQRATQIPTESNDGSRVPRYAVTGHRELIAFHTVPFEHRARSRNDPPGRRPFSGSTGFALERRREPRPPGFHSNEVNGSIERQLLTDEQLEVTR